MKRILIFLSIVSTFACLNVKALVCEDTYNVNITILGNGSIIDTKNEIEYSHDTSFKVDCGTNLSLALNPASDYSIASFKEGDTLLEGDLENDIMTYHITGDRDLYLIASFKSDFEEKTVNDGNETLTYIPSLNKLKISKNLSYVQVDFANIKGIIDENTIYNVNLDGIDLTFNSEFLNSVKTSKVKVSANKVSKNVLSTAQQTSLDSGIYYDLNVVINEEKKHELPGNVNVEISYVGQEPVVYYINDDGIKEEISSSYENGVVKFTTDHVSIYAITEKTVVEAEEKYALSDKVFTIGIIIAFVIYLIVDYFKTQKRFNR